MPVLWCSRKKNVVDAYGARESKCCWAAQCFKAKRDLNPHHEWRMGRIGLAGTPAASVPEGILRFTKEPAAIAAPAPISTPFKIVTFIPIQTLSPIVISPSIADRSSIEWLSESRIVTFSAIATLLPIDTLRNTKSFAPQLM
jgi:hypothetical protein